MRSLWLTLVYLLLAFTLGAQQKTGFFHNPSSPYALGWQTEATILPAGAGMMVAGLVSNKHKPSLIPGSYQSLDLNRLDRHSVGPIRHTPAIISDALLYTSMASPAFLIVDKNIRRDKSFYIMWAEVVLVNGAATYLTKTLVDRPRPYVYHNSPADAADIEGKEPLRSFFSGHTSMAAASMFFMAKVYSDYHPNNRWRYAVWTVAAVTPAATALLRVKAGKHFPTDVALGYVVGAATGYLVPFVHQKLQQKRLREHPQLLEGF